MIAYALAAALAVVAAVGWARPMQKQDKKPAYGSVNVYTMEGHVWCYHGELATLENSQGEEYMELHNAWLVGSSHPDYTTEVQCYE